MKIIILAAGRGSRMGIETANKPKCMTVLFGKPLIEHIVKTFIEAGFKSTDIGIVTGYKKELIQIPNVKYFHNAQWESTNMFVSLTKASEWLENEPCIMSYSDILFKPSVITKLKNSSGDISITYYTKFWELWSMRFNNPLEDLETFKLRGHRLIEIGKQPLCKDDVAGQYMGLIKFTPTGWNMVQDAIKLPMEKTLYKLDMTTLLQHLIQQGHIIEAIPTDELWLECDNMNDVQTYETNLEYTTKR
ncbi:MAG: sugar nucleotidyltransferase [Epulopiscium sp. Nuni2H_MBin003]|nr:MAG: sugar nucleotidyltransferase [Epulopiscium sp. Nuni2H_MBin003]